MVISARYAWVIRALPDEGEFETEEAAIARSWECTEPGKDRWIVDRQESARMKELYRDMVNSTLDATPYSLRGRVARPLDLPQDGVVGDLWWVEQLSDLVVLHLNEHRDLVWDRMDMGKLPFSIFEEIRARAEQEGWR